MDSSAKQQILDRLKQANNVLVTISSSPTIDQLAALVGFTLILNKMGKHATAVFSGQIPSTLEYLQPDKTIETNTDSLRDFIISLDKNKADKLRYKVEGEFVKIYITPYKSSLSENDLVYSQGDYNVEVIFALGIADKTHIDAAITAHGKILHDATIISVNAGQAKVQPLGQINWQDPTASSLCEMLVSISESFGANLMDNQMATAFLTGIVAETNRFSNTKTTPKVMTMSANLMAAGANQQLIVSKLEPPKPPVQMYMPGQQAPKAAPVFQGKPEATPQEGILDVHDQTKPTEVSVNPTEIHIDAQGNLNTAAAPAPTPVSAPEQPAPVAPPSPAYMTPSTVVKTIQPPQTTAPQPAEPDNPHALLNPDTQSAATSGDFTANEKPEWQDPKGEVSYDPLSAPTGPEPTQPAEPQPPRPAVNVDAARNAVQSAISGAPVSQPDLNNLPSPEFAAEGEAPTPSPTDLPIPAQPAKPMAPPPPFPPPLTPVNGAVIPTANKN